MSDTTAWEKDSTKIKTEILRDALKDATDTIRALDRKAQYLLSFSTVSTGAWITFVLHAKTENIFNNPVCYLILLIVGVILPFIAVILLIRTFKGLVNPLDGFQYEKDKKFGIDSFFMTRKAPNEKYILDDLHEYFVNNTETEKSTKKLLLREIAKVSFIRDCKIKKINTAANCIIVAFALDTILSILVFIVSL